MIHLQCLCYALHKHVAERHDSKRQISVENVSVEQHSILDMKFALLLQVKLIVQIYMNYEKGQACMP